MRLVALFISNAISQLASSELGHLFCSVAAGEREGGEGDGSHNQFQSAFMCDMMP